MRVIDFADGYTSASTPTVGSVSTSELQTFANDAAYVVANGTATNGDIYFNTTDFFVHYYNGTSWVVVTQTDGTQTLSNKTFSDAVTGTQIATPSSPASGKNKLYFKSDNNLYKLNSSGTESAVGGGGGGGSLQWVEDVDAPTQNVSNSILVYGFQASLGQDLYALVRVPNGYAAGSQINLRFVFYSNDTTGNALMQTVATLIRTGTDAISSTTNQRTSTNSAVSLGVGTQNKPQAVVADLTSSTGTINSVAVAAGDLIKIQLTRGTDTATSDASVPVYGAEITTQ